MRRLIVNIYKKYSRYVASDGMRGAEAHLEYRVVAD